MSDKDLVSYLRKENYCLMTEIDGAEIQLPSGQLVVMKETTGEMSSVPNTKEIRCLFNLPTSQIQLLESDLKKRKWDLKKPCLQYEHQDMVWLGKRSERCRQAIDALIDLYASDKYQKEMKRKSKTKVKMWEDISEDLRKQGFIVADNIKLAGCRTFQKWRNIIKSYWSIIKNPEDFGTDKRKKKPSYFDKLHRVLSKSEPSEFSQNSSYDIDCSEAIAGPSSEVCIESCIEESSEGGCESSTNSVTSSGTNKKDFRLSKDIVKMMIALSTTTKYRNVFDKNIPSSIGEWEKVYDFLSSMFGRYAKTRQEGACILRQKWRILQKNPFHFKARHYTPYSYKLCKSVIEDLVQNTATRGPQNVNYDFTDPLYHLLNIFESDKYLILLKNNGNTAKVWRQICNEMLSNGIYLPGGTIRQKSMRLCKRWMRLKQDFMRYQLGKHHNPELQPPPFYDKILKVIFKEIKLNNCLSKNSNMKPSTSDDSASTNSVEKSNSLTEGLVASLDRNSASTNSVEKSNSLTEGLVTSLDRATALLTEIKSISAASFDHQKKALDDIVNILERTDRNNGRLCLLISEALRDD